MAVAKLKSFLDDHHVKYVVISHSKAFTAQEVAHAAHVPGKELAKTVVVRADNRLGMAVLAASRHIDMHRLSSGLDGAAVTLATEEEFKARFPNCETGAMPPFGNLYDMPVWVDTRLAQDREIAFSAGSHSEVVRMAYADFARLVKPQPIDFAV